LALGACVPQDHSPFGERVSRAEAMPEGLELFCALVSGEVVEHRGPPFRASAARGEPHSAG
jgi:hypothetical protein